MSEQAAFNWIDRLAPDTRAAMLAYSRERNASDGEVLCNQGQVPVEFYQIVSGEIRKIMLTEEGQEILLHIYGSGDVVADSALVDAEPLPVTVVARGAVRLRVWRVSDVAAMAHQYPDINAQLARQCALWLRESLELIKELVALPVSARVASRLASLSAMHRSLCGDDFLPLSQHDIGLMVGATRQTVNRIIGALRQKRLIETRKGRLYVSDVRGLRHYAADAARKG